MRARTAAMLLPFILLACGKKSPPPVAATPPPVSTRTPAPGAPNRTPPPALAKRSTPPANTSPVGAAKPSRIQRLAPEGTYFLLQYVAVSTATGVIGEAAGTTVKLAKRDGSTLEVADPENRVFRVDESQVTNDVDLATAAARRDAAVQTATQRYVAEEIRRFERQESDATIAEEKRTAKPQATPRNNRPRC